MDAENKKQLIEKACEIISNNLGDVMAGHYRNFYQDKNLEVILFSVGELLNEMVGEENAKKQMEKLKLATKQ